MNPRISAVINTLQEEHNLPFALRSLVPWVDQIVVVDMHSSDRTREIAHAYGAEVYLHEPLGFCEPARAFGIEKCSADWVLLLDADEVVPAKLSANLRRLSLRDDIDLVSIPRVNYLLGARLNHTGWNPERDRHERFFRRGKLVTSGRIHRGYMRADGANSYELPFEEGNAILHFNYLDTAQFIEKLNRYTSIEAEQAHARGEKPSLLRTLQQATREFGKRYFLHAGFRDGWRGLHLSLLMACYRVVASSKLFELASSNDRATIRSYYAEEAEAALREYAQADALRTERAS
ncbi:MAG: glycosyltransferase family 2 protein [Myxococcota bacterium]